LREAAAQPGCEYQRPFVMDGAAHLHLAVDAHHPGAPKERARRYPGRDAELVVRHAYHREAVHLPLGGALGVDQHHTVPDLLHIVLCRC